MVENSEWKINFHNIYTYTPVCPTRKQQAKMTWVCPRGVQYGRGGEGGEEEEERGTINIIRDTGNCLFKRRLFAQML